MSKTTELAEKLAKLNIADMYENDFFLTWEKSDDEIEAVDNKYNSIYQQRGIQVDCKGK